MRPSKLRRSVVSCLIASALLVAPVPSARADGYPIDPDLCGVPSGTGSVPGDAWQNARLRPDLVWDRLTTADGDRVDGTGVTIAVIDTGAKITGTPYFDRSRVSLEDFVGDGAQLRQQYAERKGAMDCTHGTMVTSLIAAQPLDDNSSFSGIAPGATVIVMRALTGSTTQGESQDALVAAITDATRRRVDIINISQAGADEVALREAIAGAVAAGILVVVSAGNQGLGTSYPAAYPGVIAVGMTTSDDTANEKSGHSPDMTITVAAPGTDVVALLPSTIAQVTGGDAQKVAAVASGQLWQTTTGTSFAAPLVSGTIALLLQREPGLTADQVRTRLQATADPPVAVQPDPQLGWGIVNPYRALVGVPAAAGTPAPSGPTVAEPLPPVTRPSPLPGLIGVGVTLLALALVGGGLILREVLPLMRRRRFASARRDESST